MATDPSQLIAFQGVLGAYSHLACQEVFPELEPVPCASFEEAFKAVEQGKAGLAMIPIAQFRARHRIPDVHMDLYRPVMDQYRTRYDHSLCLDKHPQDKREATAQFQEHARWIHNW